MKRIKQYCTAVTLGFIFFLLSSQAFFAQDFSSLDNDLSLLENLISNTLTGMEGQQKLLESLRQNLNESGNLIAGYENTITEQEKLLLDLQVQLTEMSETFRMQSALLAKSEQRSKFWRTFTLIAIPVTAVISGTAVWAVSR